MKIFSKKPDKYNVLECTAKWDLCAIEYARSFSKSFDHSESTIARLEEILQYYYEDAAASSPTEKQLWSMSCIWGAYLGETLLKNGLSGKGFGWAVVGNSLVPVLKRGDTEYITPVDKVYKRLTNGGGDNVISFYDMVTENV